ncbi:hypothetical protein D3C84_914500 [compost metagenome]
MHDDVDAAREPFEQLRGGVGGADVQRQAAPAEACGEGLKVSFGLGYIEQHDFGAIAGQGFGYGRADAARRPGDQRLAPGQRPGPVLHLRGAGLQAQDLTGNEGALGREKKAQGAFELVFSIVTDVQQLQGAPGAQLLGQ